MKITSKGVIAFENENNSRELLFCVSDDLVDCDIYIDFEKPNGNKYKTARLTDLSKYIIPNALLDQCGILKAQLVAYRGNEFIEKSKVIYLKIGQSINASEDIVINQGDAIEELQNGKADNLTFTDNKLRLIANGQAIGDAVTINGSVYTSLVGSRESPIYYKDLESGNYIVNGMTRPSPTADVTIYESNQLIDVYRTNTNVYVYRIDRAYEIELFTMNVANDDYTRIQLPLNEILLNTMPIDDAMDIMNCYMHDKIKYENSVTQTLMISFTFPPTIANNYSSSVVFKIGDIIPQIFEVVGASVRWIGDSVNANHELVFEQHKIYTIEFKKDVFDLVGRVETRDY